MRPTVCSKRHRRAAARASSQITLKSAAVSFAHPASKRRRSASVISVTVGSRDSSTTCTRPLRRAQQSARTSLSRQLFQMQAHVEEAVRMQRGRQWRAEKRAKQRAALTRRAATQQPKSTAKSASLRKQPGGLVTVGASTRLAEPGAAEVEERELKRRERDILQRLPRLPRPSREMAWCIVLSRYTTPNCAASRELEQLVVDIDGSDDTDASSTSNCGLPMLGALCATSKRTSAAEQLLLQAQGRPSVVACAICGKEFSSALYLGRHHCDALAAGMAAVPTPASASEQLIVRM